MQKFATLILFSFAFASTLWGQSIFNNPITDTNPSASNPFTAGQVVVANITASGIGRGSGIAANAGGNRYNANGWNTGALDPAAYFTFTITPNSGFKINFVSFIYIGQASGTGPSSFAFRSSADGFAANIGTPTSGGTTISLAGASFQNVAAAIEFRLYGWGASAAAGTFSVNDFTFNGAVAALPIELINFSAKVAPSKAADLSFSTATELNNAYFSIERSQDGVRFEAIGKVTGAGTSTVKQDYTYTDHQPVKGTNFYRLKQVDFDERFSYSPIVSVNVGQLGGLRLSPQPVLDQLRIALEQSTVDDATWQVYDFTGRLLQSGTLAAESTNLEISTATLAHGSYVLRLANGQQIITQQFQKN